MQTKYLNGDVTYYQTSSEEHRAEFRNWLKCLLHEMETVEVTFKKKNGATRIMNCTLKEGIAIPHEKTTDRVKEVNQEVCPVWDIDKQAWRSFTYDSITEIRFGWYNSTNDEVNYGALNEEQKIMTERVKKAYDRTKQAQQGL